MGNAKGYNDKYKKKYPWKYVLWGITHRCKKRPTYIAKGIKCLITSEEIKKLWFRDKAYNMKTPSIHRIDNNGNYTYENCLFVPSSNHTLIHATGLSPSEVVRKKISNAQAKPICQIIDNETFVFYPSKREASIKTGISRTAISSCVHGKTKLAGGYKWVFVGEQDNKIVRTAEIETKLTYFGIFGRPAIAEALTKEYTILKK